MLDGVLVGTRRVSGAVGVLKLLVVLSLVGPAAILAFYSLQSRNLVLDEATRRAERLSDLLAKHGAATFDSYNLVFSRIDEYLRLSEKMPDESTLHAYLGDIDRQMRAVDEIALIDASAKPAAHSRLFPVPRTYVGDREYMRRLAPRNAGTGTEQDRSRLIQGKDGLLVAAPLRGHADGETRLVAARARTDSEGRRVGALVLVLSQEYFQDFYQTLALAESDRVALLRAGSTILAQIPAAPGRPSVDPDAKGGPEFVTWAASDPGLARRLSEKTVDYVSASDGVRRNAVFRKLDGYPVFVEVGYDVEAVLAPWRRQIIINLGVAALATLVLFGLVRLALAKAKAEGRMQRLVLAETAQRAEAEAALRQAQKMEALGHLTGGIAHDFNNLLNVMLINLELAAKRMQDPAFQVLNAAQSGKLGGYIEGATQGAERGAALTRRLLAFAHRQDIAPSPVHLHQLIFGVLDLLGQAAGSQVRITIDAPRTLPPVLVDPNECETVLLNLIVNAREAMPEGGRVHIAAREDKSGGPSPRRFLVLSVRDSGRGMEEKTRARDRAVLYHEGTGHWLGARPHHGRALRQPVGRRPDDRQPARRRHHHRHPLAGGVTASPSDADAGGRALPAGSADPQPSAAAS